ncbi:MAG: hypothetical protein WAM11_15200 [Cyanobium sp.]
MLERPCTTGGTQLEAASPADVSLLAAGDTVEVLLTAAASVAALSRLAAFAMRVATELPPLVARAARRAGREATLAGTDEALITAGLVLPSATWAARSSVGAAWLLAGLLLAGLRLARVLGAAVLGAAVLAAAERPRPERPLVVVDSAAAGADFAADRAVLPGLAVEPDLVAGWVVAIAERREDTLAVAAGLAASASLAAAAGLATVVVLDAAFGRASALGLAAALVLAAGFA